MKGVQDGMDGVWGGEGGGDGRLERWKDRKIGVQIKLKSSD